MAQIALSLMLLFAAGLFFRGALKAAGLNPGFIAPGDLITEFDFTLIKKTPADSRRLIFDMVRRARELPGITASAIGTMLPYSDFTSARRVLRTKDTMPNDPKAPDPSVNSLFTAITPSYCEALGIKLLRGRDFTQNECENKDARRVAMIDEEMGKKLFPNEDPIGQHIRYTNPPKDGSPNDIEVVGVYGVKAYAVACRTREIGIRMALGAHRRHVFALIMRQGAMQTALAVGAGLLLSLAAGRVLAKILYDVSPTDPLALVTATLMLASAALLACFFPANRATRVNPLTALRTE